MAPGNAASPLNDCAKFKRCVEVFGSPKNGSIRISRRFKHGKSAGNNKQSTQKKNILHGIGRRHK